MRHCAQAALAITSLTLCLTAGNPVAEAQVRGIPVNNSGVASGIALYGDVGFPDEEAGKGTAYALTGRAGFGAFGATAMISTFDPQGNGGSDVSLGATLNYRIIGAPLVPLSATLQGGIGYSKPDLSILPDDETELRFPVGLGFALTIPNPALTIRPWIAPRVDVVKVSGGGVSETETNFALGGGVEFNLLNGFGLHAAYDRVFLEGGDPSVFGVGAHYAFRIPGL
jgi:hypothetical protein